MLREALVDHSGPQAVTSVEAIVNIPNIPLLKSYSKLQNSCHRLGRDGWWPMSSCGCERIESLLFLATTTSKPPPIIA